MVSILSNLSILLLQKVSAHINGETSENEQIYTKGGLKDRCMTKGNSICPNKLNSEVHDNWRWRDAWKSKRLACNSF